MKEPLILAIESSCDETSAAVLLGKRVLSNIIATQKVHEKYGGVVPELASRAHQANIVPVVDQALQEAGKELSALDAVAFTQGPGLMGALLVGASFAKSLSHALGIPLISVHHMQAHVLAHFIENSPEGKQPAFPFLCLTVSGGHTQIVLVHDPLQMEVVGETIDDAAGEAFDKAAKVLGLPYPGGPLIDKAAQRGDSRKYTFTRPSLQGLNFSFSGLKTNLLYFLRDEKAKDPLFVEREMDHICASYQRTIVDYLLNNFERAAKKYGVRDLCIAGGVSANSELRSGLLQLCGKNEWNAFIPPFEYCTDNAAMIGITAYFKYLKSDFASLSALPQASWKL